MLRFFCFIYTSPDVFVGCISVLKLTTTEPHIGKVKIMGVKSYIYLRQ